MVFQSTPPYLCLRCGYGLGEAKERQCQVDETILVGLQLLALIGQLKSNM